MNLRSYACALFLLAASASSRAATPLRTGLANGGGTLTIVSDQNVPLVFFPAALPVRLYIVSSANDRLPVPVTGTFRPALGLIGETRTRTHGSRWHEQGGAVYLDDYGDYYFTTAGGAVKILLLSPRRDVQENVIAFFDWYCQNTQIGPADVGVFGTPVLRKLFFSAEYPNYNCGESMAAFNTYVSTLFGLRTRQVNYYGLIENAGAFWGHTVSEIEVDGRWIFFDSLFNVMAENNGRYLSLLETLTRMHERRAFTFRHAVAKDVILGPDTSPNKWDYRHWYAPERLQHIQIGPFLTPEMRPSFDYCWINAYYGFNERQYISPTEFRAMFY